RRPRRGGGVPSRCDKDGLARRWSRVRYERTAAIVRPLADRAVRGYRGRRRLWAADHPARLAMRAEALRRECASLPTADPKRIRLRGGRDPGMEVFQHRRLSDIFSFSRKIPLPSFVKNFS